MPRIPDEFLECVVYFYPSEKSANSGESVGGSGFLISMPFETDPKFVHIYIVTNSHVIREGNCLVLRINTSDGGRGIETTKADSWVHHPYGDDVAVMAMIPKNRNLLNIRYIPIRSFANKECIEKHAIGLGDEVFMVGRFISHEGKQKNLPSVRFGNIAMMPHEPVYHPTREIYQESYLVEIRSIGGYSGSPVFIQVPPFSAPRPNSPPKSAASLGVGPFLLSINWGHKHTKEKVRDKKGDPISEGWEVRSNTGMANVVPAWKLEEVLCLDELVAQRKTIEEKVRNYTRKEG